MATDTAPTFKLTYFDQPARGEPIRLAFALGGIKYEDERLSQDEFFARKPSLPLGQLPILAVNDDLIITQSHAITRFAGRLANIYPEDPILAMRVDEVADTCEELAKILTSTMSLSDEDKVSARKEAFAAGGKGDAILKRLEELIGSNSKYIFGDEITIAELWVYTFLLLLQSGTMVGIDPSHFTPETIPNCFKIHNAITSEPRLEAYFAAQKTSN